MKYSNVICLQLVGFIFSNHLTRPILRLGYFPFHPVPRGWYIKSHVLSVGKMNVFCF